MLLNSIPLAVTVVRPTFGQSLSAGSIVLIVGWLFCVKLTTFTSDDNLERLLGMAVLDALRFARLSVKEASALMGVDYYHFMAAIKGENGRRIALAPLLRLPLKFWVVLLPELTYFVTKQNVMDIADELIRVRRSS